MRKSILILLCLSLLACSGGHSNKETSNRHLPETDAPGNCPQGFVLVPSLQGYTTEDFCVAKYEMKNAGADTTSDESDDMAISQAKGTPYVEVTRDDAISKCQQMPLPSGDSGDYDLITNDEWQTLARNIESVENNWSGGNMESGDLNQGHSFDAKSFQDTILGKFDVFAASSDDNEACFATGETCDSSTWHKQRRTHILSNGELIWDLSGNVSEWVKDDNDTSYGPSVHISQVTTTSHTTKGSLSGGIERMAKDQFGPSGNYTDRNSSYYGGLGYGYLTRKSPTPNLPLGDAILRGNDSLINGSGGIFHVNLLFEKSSLSLRIGFRCVYHFHTP